MHPEGVNPSRLAAAVALVAPAVLAAVPAHATAPTGCAARSDLEHRVLVKRKPVTTRDGERLGMLRFYGGVTFDEAQDAPGTGGYGPAWCLDLVAARAFAARTPRDRGRVAYDGVTVRFAGRASTGVLSAGGGRGSNLVGQRIEVVYAVDGRTVRARRVMRLTYPAVG